MEEPTGRVYSCSTCHTRHPKPTGKKCAQKTEKPATGRELMDFMFEMRTLIAGTNQRVDILQKQVDQSRGESKTASKVADNIDSQQNHGCINGKEYRIPVPRFSSYKGLHVLKLSTYLIPMI